MQIENNNAVTVGEVFKEFLRSFQEVFKEFSGIKQRCRSCFHQDFKYYVKSFGYLF
jgi:hypothetical protein